MRDRMGDIMVRDRGALLQKFSAIAFGAGCCVSVWVYGKGNQEILALPLAFWISVYFWPDPKSATMSNGSRPPSKSGPRRGFLWAGVVASWAVAVVGLSWNAASSAHSRPSQPALETALADAETQYQKGHFAESLGVLDRLSIPDRLPKVGARRAHDCGLALLRLGRKAEAFESLSQSLQLDSKNVEAACLLSEIALSKGDLETARLYVERARAINGSYDGVQNLLRRLDQIGHDREQIHKR